LSGYDTVIKKMAVSTTGEGGKYKKFETISLIVWAAVFSVLVGVAMAVKYDQMHHLRGEKLVRMLRVTAPIGCVFAFTSYLQLVCLQYLHADVFGIFDQTRLLVMAAVSYVVLGRRQTHMAWIMLSIITVMSGAYAFVRTGEQYQAANMEMNSVVADLLGNSMYSADGSEGLLGVLLPTQVLGCSNATWTKCKHFGFAPDQINTNLLMDALEDESAANLQHLALKEHLIYKLAPTLSADKSNVHTNLAKGIPLAIFFEVLQSCAAIYQEKVLQGYSDIPIYVQKVYQEFWAFWFSLLNAGVIAPLMASYGLGRKTPDEAQLFHSPFYGWGNPWVFACFFMLITRSWLTVVIMKMLSAMVKQLCGVVAMCLVYMIAAGYDCKDGRSFCPISGLANLSWQVTLVDLGVLLSVAGFVLLKREEKLTVEALEAAQGAANAPK